MVFGVGIPLTWTEIEIALVTLRTLVLVSRFVSMRYAELLPVGPSQLSEPQAMRSLSAALREYLALSESNAG